MKSNMRYVLALSCGLLATAANAAPMPVEKAFADADHVVYAPARGVQIPHMNKSNVTNHGGGVIANAHLVFLFWGPSFCSGGADTGYAATL
ncbi:MAG TPA: hypothetical protein VGK45_02620, partial [Thermoanaerobaculia bacterium]